MFLIWHQLTVVWYVYSNGHYVGQIDLADIQVIYNPCLMTPSINSSRQPVDSTILENPGVNERCVDDLKLHKPNNERNLNAHNATFADSSNGRLSNVLVENGRIVLQYQNIHAKTCENAASTSPLTACNGQTSGRTKTWSSDITPVEYDMNDIVWKNVHAKY